jgi:molybdenum cofactor synthesis domain-containing protein
MFEIGRAEPIVLSDASALVLSISSRAASGVYEDTTGPLIVQALQNAGFGSVSAQVVPDGEPVRRALLAAAEDEVSLVVTTGGTGISPTDQTPEMTLAVVERRIPGIAEAIRANGIANGVNTAALSRGVAGIRRRTLIVNLAGSRGAVKDGLVVLIPLLEHALEQMRGGDHVRQDVDDHNRGHHEQGGTT